MKKVLVVMMLIAVFMTSTWTFAGRKIANASAVDDFVYSVDQVSKTATITDYNGGNTDVKIPSVVVVSGEKYSVTKIGNSAFKQRKLTSAVIPNSVTSIESMAFLDNQLTNIIIPSSVTELGSSAFKNNPLSNVIFEGKTTIINVNAFDASPLKKIYGYLGSTAADFASTNPLIKFSNIDDIVAVKISPNGYGSTWVSSPGRDVTLSITNPGSATDKIDYKWSNNEIELDSNVGWTASSGNETITAPTSSKIWYLHVRIQDGSGYTKITPSNPFKLDGTAPTIKFHKNPEHSTRGNVTVTASVYEYESGIDVVKYDLGQHDSNYFANAGTIPVVVDGKTNIVLSDNGWISVYAKDKVGNETVEQLKIENIDREKPVIALKGAAAIEIRQGQTYTDAGAISSDLYDGDISDRIIISGDTVDTNKIGAYTIRYNVTDNAGNAADTVIRIVKVLSLSTGPDLSSNFNLKSLELLLDGTLIPLTPKFNVGIESYTLETETKAKHLKVKANTEHEKASVIFTLNEQIVMDGVNTVLAEGKNILKVFVYAENGAQKKYTITIQQQKKPELPEQPKQPEKPIPPIQPEKPEQPKLPTDIAGHWAEQQIKQAVINKLVNGYPDGTFKPNNTVTRAEFTVMLISVLQPKSNGTTLTFKDRDTIPAWSQTAISIAVKEGIISGYQDGSFKPNKTISRAEMAMMIAKALKLNANGVTATGYKDDANIPQMAKGAVKALKEAGILNGRSNNLFAPNASMTRAEAVVLLLRVQEYN
ncbi:S-layer homology domain-containing protein [Paenibacillus sp. GSMTC-2017]|uniref:S-layer homology domain-containing protein n=1 Tax=Paenibacillus sp. GSMTC-2017 TaxID=2794350 RepID=UPI0018D7C7A1|nr:S-layer homology domain-containing protein [Paenibacillus sp. GSMTC-2017]MBH5319043.1 S-layer homology domain-containing protein [Paenibacillus sp. GSMTC-2017]